MVCFFVSLFIVNPFNNNNKALVPHILESAMDSQYIGCGRPHVNPYWLTISVGKKIHIAHNILVPENM